MTLPAWHSSCPASQGTERKVRSLFKSKILTRQPPRGSLCSCFKHNLNNIDSDEEVFWVLQSLSHSKCQRLFGNEQNYFIFPCSGTHTCGDFALHSPKVWREKVISIATVCPRQKTPMPQQQRREIPPGFGDSPPGRGLIMLPLVSLDLPGTAAPKLLGFTWVSPCTGGHREPVRLDGFLMFHKSIFSFPCQRHSRKTLNKEISKVHGELLVSGQHFHLSDPSPFLGTAGTSC